MATDYFDQTKLAVGTRVVEVVSVEPRLRGSQKHAFATFRCACGKVGGAWASALRSGVTRSCGCLQRDVSSVRNRTHGLYAGADRKHPLYVTWCRMLARCYLPETREYPRYGGRGIKVCARWRGKNGFAHFIADMGSRPNGSTLDRRDNDKGYSPKNCQWATRLQQQRNTRRNRRLRVGKEVHTLSEWAERTGLRRTTISQRIKHAWPVERAVTAPAQQGAQHGN